VLQPDHLLDGPERQGVRVRDLDGDQILIRFSVVFMPVRLVIMRIALITFILARICFFIFASVVCHLVILLAFAVGIFFVSVLPIVVLAVYVLPGSFGAWEWYFALPELRLLRGLLATSQYTTARALPDAISFAETQSLLAAAAAGGRRLQALPGPSGTDGVALLRAPPSDQWHGLCSRRHRDSCRALLALRCKLRDGGGDERVPARPRGRRRRLQSAPRPRKLALGFAPHVLHEVAVLPLVVEHPEGATAVNAN